jgi:hypothetical protein
VPTTFDFHTPHALAVCPKSLARNNGKSAHEHPAHKHHHRHQSGPASTHKHLGKRAARCPVQILACGWFGSPILLPARVGCRSGARPHVVTGPGSSTVQPPLGAPQSRSSTRSSRSKNPLRDRASAGIPTRSSVDQRTGRPRRRAGHDTGRAYDRGFLPWPTHSVRY